jgi:hypothetical protein
MGDVFIATSNISEGLEECYHADCTGVQNSPQCPGIIPHSVATVMPMTTMGVLQAIAFQMREFLAADRGLIQDLAAGKLL